MMTMLYYQAHFFIIIKHLVFNIMTTNNVFVKVVIGQWFENMVKIPLFLSNARDESMVKYTQKVM
jgi:hypothetical protein